MFFLFILNFDLKKKNNNIKSKLILSLSSFRQLSVNQTAPLLLPRGRVRWFGRCCRRVQQPETVNAAHREARWPDSCKQHLPTSPSARCTHSAGQTTEGGGKKLWMFRPILFKKRKYTIDTLMELNRTWMILCHKLLQCYNKSCQRKTGKTHKATGKREHDLSWKRHNRENLHLSEKTSCFFLPGPSQSRQVPLQ